MGASIRNWQNQMEVAAIGRRSEDQHPHRPGEPVSAQRAAAPITRADKKAVVTTVSRLSGVAASA